MVSRVYVSGVRVRSTRWQMADNDRRRRRRRTVRLRASAPIHLSQGPFIECVYTALLQSYSYSSRYSIPRTAACTRSESSACRALALTIDVRSSRSPHAPHLPLHATSPAPHRTAPGTCAAVVHKTISQAWQWVTSCQCPIP
jgi:hypothetical protein